MHAKAIVTVPPHADFLEEVARHPVVGGLRLNTVMPIKGSARDVLARLSALGQPLWIDLKGRQLRVAQAAVPPFTEVRLSHRIEVDLPAVALFKNGTQSTRILEVDGDRLILEDGPLFIADTHVRTFPDPEYLSRVAIGAARHVRRFGVEPKIAFCSQSQFGNQGEDSGKRLRATIRILDSEPRDFCYEGEMNVDAALDPELRARLLPDNRMEGAANVLIFSNADAASGVRNILKMKGGGLEVGPILMGMGNRAHIVTPSITARGLLNMAAIAGTPVAHYG